MDEKEMKKLFDEEMMKMNTETIQLGANSLHDLFDSFVKAGFSRKESLELVKAMMIPLLQVGLASGGK